MCTIEKDKVEEKWTQVITEIKNRWSSLSVDDILQINGSKELLIIRIQEKCGKGKNEAEKEVDDFERDLV